MKRDIIECPSCGKSITPEEVEAGISVSCPACEDTDTKEKPSRQQKTAGPGK